jgi:hypothetical protein
MLKVQPYPHNGRKIHQINRLHYNPPPNPLPTMIKLLESTKLVPIKLDSYLVVRANRLYLVMDRDLPVVNGIIIKYNSRMDDLIRMLNLFHRTFRLNSQGDIDELKRLNNILFQNAVTLASTLRGVDLNRYPSLRDNLRAMMGKTDLYISSVVNILRQFGKD